MFKEFFQIVYMIFIALIYIGCVVTLGIFIGMLQILGLNKNDQV